MKAVYQENDEFMCNQQIEHRGLVSHFAGKTYKCIDFNIDKDMIKITSEPDFMYFVHTNMIEFNKCFTYLPTTL